MDIHKNARLTPHSRAELVRRVRGARAEPEGRGHGLRALRQDRAQVGGALACGRGGRARGPFLAAAPPAPADAGGDGRAGRGAAPAALDGQADRRRGRRLAGDRQPRPAAAGAQQARRAGAGRAGPALRAEHPGELIHIDIKKLGRFEAVGHRITGDAGRATAPAPAGSSSRSASTTPRGSPSPRSCPTSGRKAPTAFLEAAVAWYQSLGVTVARGHDRQRPMLGTQRGLRHQVAGRPRDRTPSEGSPRRAPPSRNGLSHSEHRVRVFGGPHRPSDEIRYPKRKARTLSARSVHASTARSRGVLPPGLAPSKKGR